MFSLRSIALATTAAAALVPGIASANTYCVLAQDCNGTPEWSIQDAINAAEGDGGAGRIELGEGTYSGNFVVPAHPGGTIAIVGRGTDKTVLEPAAYGSYGLELHGASVSQLEIGLPDVGGSDTRGLLLMDGASADHIRAVITGNWWATPVRIEGGGGHLSHAYIDAGTQNAVTIGGDHGFGDATLTDSYIRGETPISVFNEGHTLLAQRNQLVVTDDYMAGVQAYRGTAIVEDSLIDLRGLTHASAIKALTTKEQPASIDARHLTVRGGGNDTAGAIATTSSGAPAAAALADSVLLNVGERAVAEAGGANTVSVTRVDTWPAAPDNVAAGSLTEAGSFSSDPLLTTDLVPGAGSPLIDAAAPLGAGESDTDAEGNARSLDGDGSCDARPDIGAFEAPAAACVPPAPQPNVQPQPPATDATAPAVTKVRLVHRRSVRFTVSEAARVTIRITRAHRKAIVVKRTVAAGAVALKLKHRLAHGRYAIRVLAVDTAGNRSAPAIVRRRV